MCAVSGFNSKITLTHSEHQIHPIEISQAIIFYMSDVWKLITLTRFFFTVFISTASKLSILLTHKPLIEKLALCLDRDMRSILNWKDLAWEMKVDEKVIERLEHYSDFSPTIRLFEHLEVTQPDLDIEQLRNALLDIGRKDLFSLLTTEGNHHV